MILALIGKTASGKTTILNQLQNWGYEKIVTYTTRAIRPGEVDGIDYHFISEEEFMAKDSQNFFLETTHYDMTTGRVFYGTAKADVMGVSSSYKTIILNPEGFAKFKLLDVPMISFYLKCSVDEITSRLIGRGDDKAEALRRIKADEEDFKKYKIANSVDYVLSNDVGLSARDMADLISRIYSYIVISKDAREGV